MQANKGQVGTRGKAGPKLGVADRGFRGGLQRGLHLLAHEAHEVRLAHGHHAHLRSAAPLG